jgi:hypothetical protein
MRSTKRTKRADRHLRPADIGLADWTGTATAHQRADTGKQGKERRTSEPVPPQRGWARPFAGRCPRLPAVPVHRGSTGQEQGL